MPEFTVFQTPPDATATKYFALSVGSTANAITRPDVTAGPIDRNLKPPKTCGPNGSSGDGAAEGDGDGWTTVVRVESPAGVAPRVGTGVGMTAVAGGVGDASGRGGLPPCPKTAEVTNKPIQTRTNVERNLCTERTPWK